VASVVSLFVTFSAAMHVDSEVCNVFCQMIGGCKIKVINYEEK